MNQNDAGALTHGIALIHGIDQRWPGPLAGPRWQPLCHDIGGEVPPELVRARARFLLLEAIGDASARDGDSRCPRLEEAAIELGWMTRAEANEARARFGLEPRS